MAIILGGGDGSSGGGGRLEEPELSSTAGPQDFPLLGRLVHQMVQKLDPELEGVQGLPYRPCRPCRPCRTKLRCAWVRNRK